MLAEKQLLEEIKIKGITLEQLIEVIPKDKVKVDGFFASETSLDDFKHAVVNVCSSTERSMIMSYSRRTLGQVLSFLLILFS